jgi:hypothetical protein
VTGKVQNGGSVEESILDVGLGGSHHFDSEIISEFFLNIKEHYLLDKFYKLIILELIADLKLRDDFILGNGYQWVSKEICNVYGSHTFLPPLFLFFFALIDYFIDVITQTRILL